MVPSTHAGDRQEAQRIRQPLALILRRDQLFLAPNLCPLLVLPFPTTDLVKAALS